MVFAWLKRRRRRQLAAQPFPAHWFDVLRNYVVHYQRLLPGEQSKLRHDLRILVAEKNWEGCGGLVLNDQVKVTIAAQAALLLLGFDQEYYDRVQSVLVYPDAYLAKHQTPLTGGGVLEELSGHTGEAWYRGPVIVSWADALASGRGQGGGRNVVIHEFAHQLDMRYGLVLEGTSPKYARDPQRRWSEVLDAEYRRLVRDCERGAPTLLDCYGATSKVELFAVASECFIERPHAMRREHPELYDILRQFYRQDPAGRP